MLSFGKKYNQSVQSVLSRFVLGFATHEHRVKGNSWNAYVALNPITTSGISHKEYVNTKLGPYYQDMIKKYGGVKSATWKAEQKNLVEQHERLKEKQGKVMGAKPKRQVSVMRQLGKRWKQDMDTAASCSIHIAVIMISSEYGAEKES